MSKERPATAVTTGKGRLSYQNLFEPSAMNDDQEKKYNTAFMWPKTDTVTTEKVKKAIEAAKKLGIEKCKKWKGKVPAVNFKEALHDGDVEKPELAEYAGMWFVSAKSKNAPNIVDKAINPIMDRSQVYSGAYARISVNFFPFETGSNGIGCGLNNVQILGGGEPLSGGSRPEDDFADDFEDDTNSSPATVSADEDEDLM